MKKWLPLDYNEGVHDRSQYSSCRRQFRFEGKTSEDAVQWQQEFRPVLKQLLGIDKLEKSYTEYIPEARLLHSTEEIDHIREEWIVWTEPTVPLKIYVLHPLNSEGMELPLALTPHGHNHPHLYVGLFNSEKEKAHIIAGDRDIAVQAVRNGFRVISPTTRGFGNTRTSKDRWDDSLHSCRELLLHDLLVGRTPIGDRVWDISTLISWAKTQWSVDKQRILITGNSGGGTTSLFAAACDLRISMAVPASYFNSFKGSIGAVFHCDCNFIPGILDYGEMSDIAGLIAPRPLRIITGRFDHMYPVAETQSAYQEVLEIYKAMNVSHKCTLYIGSEGHRYYAEGAWQIVSEQLLNPHGGNL